VKNNKFVAIDRQKIVSIWLVEDDFGEEICGLAFENGYFLIKGTMSPIGTGHADLHLFDTIEAAKRKFAEVMTQYL